MQPTNFRTTLGALAVIALLAACAPAAIRSPEPAAAMTPAKPFRVATFNTSLYDTTDGGLVARLRKGDAKARKIAAVIQHQRPDILLLNEFDYDAAGAAADLFQRDYLEVGQSGQAPMHYPYRYFAPVNTGVPSGMDLNRDGKVEGGDDAFGFGLHPGQYGMLVLSRFPIDAGKARTFQLFLWKDLPQARVPRIPGTGEPYYTDAQWAKFRLSSKSHWDVPVNTPAGVVHLLASHPTPPVFDGPENRNGLRNADEIRFWHEYISPGARPWLCDDQGACGGLAGDARFVIAGDLNSDPNDGDSLHEAIVELLEHPRVLRYATPTSEGAIVAAREKGGANLTQRGSPAHKTGAFGPRSATCASTTSCPRSACRSAAACSGHRREHRRRLARRHDHHMVWVDLR